MKANNTCKTHKLKYTVDSFLWYGMVSDIEEAWGTSLSTHSPAQKGPNSPQSAQAFKRSSATSLGEDEVFSKSTIGMSMVVVVNHVDLCQVTATATAKMLSFYPVHENVQTEFVTGIAAKRFIQEAIPASNHPPGSTQGHPITMHSGER